MDYEPEDPPSFSPADVDISELEDRLLTPEQGSANISSSKDDLPAYPAEDAVMAGRKRRQNFPEDEEQSRKAARDEVAALPKSGRKPLNTDRDDVRGYPSKGESKPSTDPDGGRFVAVRGTGSNAPAVLYPAESWCGKIVTKLS